MAPLIRLKNVVLPAPFGPMMALILFLLERDADFVDGAQAAETLGQVLDFKHVSFPSAGCGQRRLRPVSDGRHSGWRCAMHCAPSSQVGADDTVRHEDHQDDQQRTEHDETVVLQELQVLGEPGHADRAQQRAEQGADAADQHVHGHVEGMFDAGDAGAQEAHETGVQAACQAGVEHRQHEGQHLVAHQVDAQRLGQVVAVADRHEGAAQQRIDDAVHEEDCQHQEEQHQVILRRGDSNSKPARRATAPGCP